MRSYLRVWPNGETSEDQIILSDLTTGKSNYLGSGGYAAWSPDKKSIAVVHILDEIEEAQLVPYLTIVNPNGREEKVLVLQNRNGELSPAKPAN